MMDEANRYKHMYFDAQDALASLEGTEKIRSPPPEPTDSETIAKLTRKLKSTEEKLLTTESELGQYKTEYRAISSQLKALEDRVACVATPEATDQRIAAMEREWRAKESAYKRKIAELTRQVQERENTGYDRTRILQEIQGVQDKINTFKL
jgi:chromosome segregation ATPase